MNASISLIKWEEKYIINEVRKICAMWRMSHHPLFWSFFFLEVGCAAGAGGARGSGGAVRSGMVKGKWECKIKNMRKLKLRRDQKEGMV